MDGERAETYLRLLAEAELRGHATPAGDVAPLGLRHNTARLSRVARALTTVGAVDAGTVDAILANFELAMAVRQTPFRPIAPRPPGVRRRMAKLVSGAMQVSLNPGGSARNPGSASRPGPDRVVPVGMMVPLRDEEVRGELYLMAFSQTASGARLSVHAWLRDTLSDLPPHGSIHLLRNLAATDDQGIRYSLGFVGSGTIAGLNGFLRIDPAPPAGIRWLELAGPGGPTRRVSLDWAAHPAIAVTEITRSPGEHLLHATAAQILTAAAETTSQRRLPTAAARREASQLTAGLGDIVEALLAAGVLSPLSPVPGQLATLCESLDLRDHGITALLAPDLPKPWLSVLSYVHRRKLDAAPHPVGCADVAVALPELDGIAISILGLHASEEGTVLHMLATGVKTDAESDASFLPVLWLRDDTGRWHATRAKGWNTTQDGDATTQLQVLPPLTHCTSIDIIAAGQSAEVRTTLHVRWR